MFVIVRGGLVSKLTGMAALVVLLNPPAPAASATSSPALPSPAAVLALGEHGLGAEYEATYEVTGELAIFPGPRWTVVVAHRGAQVGTSPTFEDGNWAFFLHAGEGYELQWVEAVQHFEDCWRTRMSPHWRCGQGTYEPSNGFSMATVPYITATALSALSQGVHPAPPQRQSLKVFWRPSSHFGRLVCLTSTVVATEAVPGERLARHPFVTTCLTSGGLPASQDGWDQGLWDHLVLVGLRPLAPASDFRLVSAPSTSSVLPPL